MLRLVVGERSLFLFFREEEEEENDHVCLLVAVVVSSARRFLVAQCAILFLNLFGGGNNNNNNNGRLVDGWTASPWIDGAFNLLVSFSFSRCRAPLLLSFHPPVRQADLTKRHRRRRRTVFDVCRCVGDIGLLCSLDLIDRLLALHNRLRRCRRRARNLEKRK